MLSKTKMEKKIVENGKAVFHNNICYPRKMGKYVMENGHHGHGSQWARFGWKTVARPKITLFRMFLHTWILVSQGDGYRIWGLTLKILNYEKLSSKTPWIDSKNWQNLSNLACKKGCTRQPLLPGTAVFLAGLVVHRPRRAGSVHRNFITKTAHMDGLHCSSNDPHYRIGLVPVCEAESVTQRLSCSWLVTGTPS